MNLKTKIVAKKTQQLQKYLASIFDHSYTVSPSDKDPSGTTPQVSDSQLLKWASPTSSDFAHCVVAYNWSLKASSLRRVLKQLPSPWKVILTQYDGKSGETLSVKKTDDSDEMEFEQYGSEEITCALQIQTSNSSTVRVYFLPSFLTGNYPLMPSVHQIFKLLRVLQAYYSLDQHLDEEILFHDTLTTDLSDFLYQRQVRNLEIFMRAIEQREERVLQQVARLKVPEKWLEKPQYRHIKRQIYLIKKKERSILKELHNGKHEVVETINGLLHLTGKNSLTFHEISVDTLKQLKAESIGKKVAEIGQLEAVLKSMEMRKLQLQDRKQQLLNQKQQSQQQQVTELLKLKNQVLQLKSTSITRSLFKETQPQTSKTPISAHKQLITTIFSRAQRKKEASQVPPQLENTQLSIKKTAKIEKKAGQSGQFRQAEKKMAAVVRDANTQSSELNLRRVNEERQRVFLEIDFEAEREHTGKLLLLRKAGSIFARALENADEMMFFQE